MKDEKKESKLREQLLDEKVSELRQTHGELLPGMADMKKGEGGLSKLEGLEVSIGSSYGMKKCSK